MPLPFPAISLKKRYAIAIHVVLWSVFGTWIFYLAATKQPITFGKAVDLIVGLLIPVSIFYFNWYVLISKYLARNKIFLYLVTVLATLFAVALIQAPIDYYIFRKYNPGMASLYNTERMIQYVVSGLVVVFISSALKVTGNYIRNERLNKELETQKLTAELAYLKSQVNPHFLFNTLNNIYSLAYKQSPDTPDAIMKLSLLMRYMLYESNDTLVNLEKEVDHIHNFIDLQKLRLREKSGIRFTIEGDLTGKQIAPMLLMTLVENAFKHGLISKNEIGITLNLKVEKERLIFSTINNTSTHKKKEFGGIGLENLKRRLNLLYENRHKLTFNEKEGTFYATLKLYFQH
jgi:two-component system, LytTR family, sensor kinase